MGAELDPAEACVERLLQQLKRLDAQMVAEGFGEPARRRCTGEVVYRFVQAAVEGGFLQIESGEPGEGV